MTRDVVYILCFLNLFIESNQYLFNNDDIVMPLLDYFITLIILNDNFEN